VGGRKVINTIELAIQAHMTILKKEFSMRWYYLMLCHQFSSYLSSTKIIIICDPIAIDGSDQRLPDHI